MESTDTPVLLMLNLPESALAGIDLLSFTTTPRFRGVKNLPPGLHLAFAGSTTAFSERHGVWFTVPKTEKGKSSSSLFATQWDAPSESLHIQTAPSEILRLKANLGSIWRDALTPYRQVVPKSENAEAEANDNADDWPLLTGSITPQLLSRITGSTSTWRLSSASSSKGDLEVIPGLADSDLNLSPEEELHFLPIDLKQTWREGATGRERTDAAQDRSWALNNLIQTHCTDGDANEIIGEIQFCFLMVLTLNNFSCFEQWKRVLSLLFTCKSAVAERATLFISAIAALRLQLQHCKDAEGGLIDLADEGGSLLKNLLVRFRKGLEGTSDIGVQDVLDELDDLEEYLREEHGWQFGGSFVKTGLLELEDGEQVRMDTTAFDADDETGEFAPQIVDLTPAQARMLGVEDEVDLPATLIQTSLKDRHPDELEDISDKEDMSDSDESEEVLDLDELDARY